MCIDALMCYKMCFKCVKNKRMDCVNGLGCPMVQSGVSSHRIPFFGIYFPPGKIFPLVSRLMIG